MEGCSLSVMQASQVCSGPRGARVRDAVYDLCKPFSTTVKMSECTYFGDDGWAFIVRRGLKVSPPLLVGGTFLSWEARGVALGRDAHTWSVTSLPRYLSGAATKVWGRHVKRWGFVCSSWDKRQRGWDLLIAFSPKWPRIASCHPSHAFFILSD